MYNCALLLRAEESVESDLMSLTIKLDLDMAFYATMRMYAQYIHTAKSIRFITVQNVQKGVALMCVFFFSLSFG